MMQEEDRQLLARAKWLVSSFAFDDDTGASIEDSDVLVSRRQSARHHVSQTDDLMSSIAEAVAEAEGMGTDDLRQTSSAVLVVDEEMDELKRGGVELPHWPSADGRMLLSFVDFLVEVFMCTARLCALIPFSCVPIHQLTDVFSNLYLFLTLFCLG